MIDRLRLAELAAGATGALRARCPASGFTCVICGAEQEGLVWRVSLPERAGPACTGCATDAGFTVDY